MPKQPITQEGQPCRQCGTSVIKQQHQADWQPDTKRKAYHFKWWFKCPKCKAMYMVEAAKVWHEGRAADKERLRLATRRHLEVTTMPDKFGFFPGRDG